MQKITNRCVTFAVVWLSENAGCWKSLYKSVPSVPLSHCPKWDHVFCISCYISIYYLFYYIFYCLFGTVGQWDTWDTWYSFPLFSSLFHLSCHLPKVYICHASCCCICKIFKNRGVKFAVVCLSENVWPFEKSL